MSNTSIGTVNNVRCVAGGVYPASDWKDNGDGTVRDNRSGLYYQKCSYGLNNDANCSGTIGTINWQNSLSYCDTLALAGRKWRLPNINELIALADLTQTAAPFVNATYFPGVPIDGAYPVPIYYYWSSTTMAANGFYSHLLNFSQLSVAGMDTKRNANNLGNPTYYYLARCVSGP